MSKGTNTNYRYQGQTQMDNKTRNNIYVCDSIYHIYLSILKSRALDGNHLIYIKDTIPHSKVLQKKLENTEFFSKVIMVYELDLLAKRSPILSILFFKCFEPLHYNLKIENTRIYLFLDTTLFAKFLLKNYPHLHFILVEEGEQLYALYENKFKDFIKKLFKLPLGYGRDKEIKTIEAQNLQRLDYIRRNKAIHFKLHDLESKLTVNETNKIFQLFGYYPDALENEELSILLTQPLSEDGFITENEKISLYKRIVSEHSKGERLIVKVHPREKTNYSIDFPNSIIMPGYFPIELLNHSSINISKGITLFSSALNNLKGVNEKIFLGINYSTKVKENYESKLGLKFDYEEIPIK